MIQGTYKQEISLKKDNRLRLNGSVFYHVDNKALVITFLLQKDYVDLCYDQTPP